MTDFSSRSDPASPEIRLSPAPQPNGGAARRPAGSTEAPEREPVEAGQVIRVLRRQRIVIIGAIVLALSAAMLRILTTPNQFRATAVVRLASERQALASGMETTVPAMSRTTDPLLSIVQLLRSRVVVGDVVDSLGLQLRPVETRSRLGSLVLGPIPVPELDGVRLGAEVVRDTIHLVFTDSTVVALMGTEEAGAAYGKPVRLGAVEFVVREQPPVAQAMLAIDHRDKAIDRVLAVLTVSPRPGTDVFDVRYTDLDPARAQRVVNEAVRAFQDANIESAQLLARRRRVFLAGQLKETDVLLDRARRSLTAFLRSQRIASTGDRIAAEEAAHAALTARRGGLEADRMVFTSLLGKLQSTSDSDRADGLNALAYAPEVGSDPRISRLQQQIFVYQTRLDSLTSGRWRAAATDPDVQQLRGMTGSLQEELVQAVRARITSLEQRSAALAGLGARSGAALRSLPATQAAASELQQRVQSLSALHDQIRLDHEKARMAEEVEAGDVGIIDLAPLPYKPTGASPGLLLGIAMLLGIVLGTGAAFVREHGSSLRRPEDIERYLQIPGLAVIPPVLSAEHGGIRARLGGLLGSGAGGERSPDGLVAPSRSASVEAEAFRMLRTGLLWSEWGGGQLRSIVITSSLPAEGKSLTAMNLAAAFAQDGKRVLLVDGDLRGARLHRALNVNRSPGLSDLLEADGVLPEQHGSSYAFLPAPERPRDEVWKDALIHSTSVPGLSLLPAGKRAKDGTALVTEAKIKRLLESAMRSYDVIILDAPPVLAAADAAVLSAIADGVVFVISAGRTDREAAERAVRRLQRVGARVIGAVLNDPRGEVPQFGDYYYPYEYGAPAAQG